MTEARAGFIPDRELTLMLDNLSYSAGRAELMLQIEKIDA